MTGDTTIDVGFFVFVMLIFLVIFVFLPIKLVLALCRYLNAKAKSLEDTKKDD